jgi:hypothetical protein
MDYVCYVGYHTSILNWSFQKKEQETGMLLLDICGLAQDLTPVGGCRGGCLASAPVTSDLGFMQIERKPATGLACDLYY